MLCVLIRCASPKIRKYFSDTPLIWSYVVTSIEFQVAANIVPERRLTVFPIVGIWKERKMTKLITRNMNMTIVCYYSPFDITRKIAFCLSFYFKWKYFVLPGHVFSETIFLFCFCALFLKLQPKIKFTATEKCSGLCNFYSEVILLNIYIRKYSCFLWWSSIIYVSWQ